MATALQFTYQGTTRTLREWARHQQLSPKTVYDRYTRWGWSLEEALELVPRPPSPRSRHRTLTLSPFEILHMTLQTIAETPSFAELHRRAQAPDSLHYVGLLEMTLQTIQRTVLDALVKCHKHEEAS
jgi:hypothetical protein